MKKKHHIGLKLHHSQTTWILICLEALGLYIDSYTDLPSETASHIGHILFYIKEHKKLTYHKDSCKSKCKYLNNKLLCIQTDYSRLL